MGLEDGTVRHRWMRRRGRTRCRQVTRVGCGSA
uniref:Uncharacterized protein n=1 Tax=Arundo donax TaxID=35708 RepID=A0A0A9AMX6_ARUDO